jgi:hypothetical protein
MHTRSHARKHTCAFFGRTVQCVFVHCQPKLPGGGRGNEPGAAGGQQRGTGSNCCCAHGPRWTATGGPPPHGVDLVLEQVDTEKPDGGRLREASDSMHSHGVLAQRPLRCALMSCPTCTLVLQELSSLAGSVGELGGAAAVLAERLEAGRAGVAGLAAQVRPLEQGTHRYGEIAAGRCALV